MIETELAAIFRQITVPMRLERSMIAQNWYGSTVPVRGLRKHTGRPERVTGTHCVAGHRAL